MRTDSLGIASGELLEAEINLPAVAMYLDDGEPNLKIGDFVANTGETVNLEDAYATTEFDFGTKVR